MEVTFTYCCGPKSPVCNTDGRTAMPAPMQRFDDQWEFNEQREKVREALRVQSCEEFRQHVARRSCKRNIDAASGRGTHKVE